MKEILLTGGLGFIGRNVLSELVKKKITVHLLVRPEKQIPQYAKTDLIRPIYTDLEQIDKFDGEIRKRHFDTIFHIGAIRGGAGAGREAYKKGKCRGHCPFSTDRFREKCKIYLLLIGGSLRGHPQTVAAFRGDGTTAR